MEKSDIREIKKVVKAKESAVDWVYSIYVDSENAPRFENVCRLSDMEEAERFRHEALFAKLLSTRTGRDAFPIELEEQNEPLLTLRSAEKPETERFAAFRDALLAGYAHTDPYYATLARIVYDVPRKAADGSKLEDGDVVYEALLFGICPAKLTRAALGFDTDRVTEMERRWQIGNPVSGFLYPAFSERLEDRNEILLHSSRPDEEDFLKELFRFAEEARPVGVKLQKNLFSEFIGQMEMDLESAATITEALLETAAEEDAPQILEKQTALRIAETAGAVPEDLGEIFDEVIGTTPLSMEAITEQYVTVCTDLATVKIPAKSAQLIETRRIDGRDYILIPADGAVTVNGAAVIAAKRSGKNDMDTQGDLQNDDVDTQTDDESGRE